MRILPVLLLILTSLNLCGSDVSTPPWDTPKDPVIESMATQITDSLFSSYRVTGPIRSGKAEGYLSTLQDDGRFTNLSDNNRYKALLQIWVIAQVLDSKGQLTPEIRAKLYRALVHYCEAEAKDPSPWPIGCFHSPMYFLGAWFNLKTYLDEDWEQQPALRPTLEALYESGQAVAAQSWNFPVRTDQPDAPLSIEHFRGSSAYMVANFYPYRPLMAYALFLGSDRHMALTIETAKRSLMEPVDPTDLDAGFWPQGVNPDSIVTAHGQQSYMYGYGKDYLRGMIKLADLTRGTAYEFTPEQMNRMADLLLDGMQWFIYRGQIDYSLLGRHNLYPHSGADGGNLLQAMTRALLDATPTPLARADELQSMMQRLDAGESFSGSRYFWNVEDYVHRSADYAIVVNASSTRIAGPEITERGRQNYHFGNGVSMIYTGGDEYATARGGMNFRALPGITASFGGKSAPFAKNWHGIHGRNEFSGGVSDGRSGIIAFESMLDDPRETVKAKKSWFFHGDTMVCLGSDIHADDPDADIQTTINQTIWRTPASVWEDGQAQPTTLENQPDGPLPLLTPAVIWQDNVAYVIQDGEATLDLARTATNWKSLSDDNKPNVPTAEVDLFRLYLEHYDDLTSSYAYAVYPAISAAKAASLAQQIDWQVLANSASAQAVEFPQSGWIGAVFYEPGSVEANTVSLQVDSPLVLQIEIAPDDSLTLVYEDPLRRLAPVAPTLEVTFHQDDGSAPTVKKIELPLPQGMDLGKPRKLAIGPASDTPDVAESE